MPLCSSVQGAAVLGSKLLQSTLRWGSDLRSISQEEANAHKKKGEGEDAAERALKQMMGGHLAGESKVNKLSEQIVKPAHLIPGEVRAGRVSCDASMHALGGASFPVVACCFCSNLGW